MFKLRFKTIDSMWNFIDSQKLSNFTASNSSLTVKLDGQIHNQYQLAEIAKKFGGELVPS